jgi:hypothetical protein
VTHTLWAVASPVVPLPQVLDEADCHYNVEVHIETPRNAEGAAEIQLLKASIPHAVILAGALWVSVLVKACFVLVMSTKCALMCLVTWIVGHYITCHASLAITSLAITSLAITSLAITSLSVTPNDLNHKRTLMHAPKTTTAWPQCTTHRQGYVLVVADDGDR